MAAGTGVEMVVPPADRRAVTMMTMMAALVAVVAALAAMTMAAMTMAATIRRVSVNPERVSGKGGWGKV
jgi:hypothetical protein